MASYPTCPIYPYGINHETAKYPLGAMFEWDGKTFQYVQKKDAVASANKMPLVWDDHATYAVTADVSGAEDTAVPEVAGFACGVVTADYYTFIQKSSGALGLAGVPKKAGVDSIPAGGQMVSGTGTDDGVLNYLTPLVDPSSAGSPSDAELQLYAELATRPKIITMDASDDTADTVDVMFDILP